MSLIDSKSLNNNPKTPGQTRQNWARSGSSTSTVEAEVDAIQADYVSATNVFATDNRVLRSDGTTRGAQASTTTMDDEGKTTFSGAASKFYPTLGSEILTGVGWTSTNWTGDFANGFTHTTGNTSTLSYPAAPTVGVNYRLTYTMSGRTAGSITFSLGGVTHPTANSTNAVRIEAFMAETTDDLRFSPTSTFDGTISNISLVQMTASESVVIFQDNDPSSSFEIRTLDASLQSVAMGLNAGRYMILGGLGGGRNVLIGSGAGQSLGTGQRNVFIGLNAGRDCSIGLNNVCIGEEAGENLTSGLQNFLLGVDSGSQLTSQSNNMLIGHGAGFLSTGTRNVGIGTQTLNATTGDDNIAFGFNAGFDITSGSQNIFIGSDAGDSGAQLATASNSIGIGFQVDTTASNQIILGNTSHTQTIFRGTVDICRSANACRANVYNTAAADPPGTSFELCAIRWDSNVAKIGTHKGSGGGTARDLVLETDGTERMRFGATTGRCTVKQFLNLDAATELTIASGVITITKSYHRIDTEADGATDDLVTINGGVEGDILVLRAENGARDVVVKDGTGNIQCAGDCTLDNVQDTITLLFDGTNWLELCRSNNGA